MERYELPDGWEWRTLGEFCHLERGITFPASAKSTQPGENLTPCLRTANVQEKVDWDDLIYVPRSYVKSASKQLRQNDILISMANSLELVGKVSFVDDLRFASTFGGFISAIRVSDDLSPKFAFYYFRTQAAIQHLRESSNRSVNIANLSIERVKSISIPYPPLHEQEEVVAKIESLFKQSNAARVALTRAPELMSQFRRAVLASAFRGELVEPDPNDEPAASLLERVREGRASKGSRKLVHPEVPNTDDLPKIPKTWVWATLESLAEIRNGVTKGRDLSRFETVEVPYLRVANVQAGYLDLREVKTIKVKQTELEKIRLKPNDILFTEGGDRDKLGRGTVWRGEIDVCTHQNHIHCARLYLQDIVPDWVSLASQLSYARDYFFSVASQTVNLASLNSTQLKGVPVPLPPVNEQKRILEKVKVLFAQAEIIERAASVSLRRAEQVDQSILARAFRGELS